MASRIHGMWLKLPFLAKNTVSRATIAPAAPVRLPRRAVFGDDNPFKARMKQAAATRYRTSTVVSERMFTDGPPAADAL
jgi:hypothetical protein